jgi:hypothetical protein
MIGAILICLTVIAATLLLRRELHRIQRALGFLSGQIDMVRGTHPMQSDNPLTRTFTAIAAGPEVLKMYLQQEGAVPQTTEGELARLDRIHQTLLKLGERLGGSASSGNPSV